MSIHHHWFGAWGRRKNWRSHLVEHLKRRNRCRRTAADRRRHTRVAKQHLAIQEEGAGLGSLALGKVGLVLVTATTTAAALHQRGRFRHGLHNSLVLLLLGLLLQTKAREEGSYTRPHTVCVVTAARGRQCRQRHVHRTNDNGTAGSESAGIPLGSYVGSGSPCGRGGSWSSNRSARGTHGDG